MQILRKKVLRFIEGERLFSPGEKVIVAFSGGADSMALLDILGNLPGFPLTLVVAHLNHMLRRDESDGDELFARSIAEKYALPFEKSRVDIAVLASEKGASLEEAGREARRAFLLETAERYSAAAVSLGHHRDDQAETVMMRLVRGAAGSGLTGMPPKKVGSLFVRPLLCLDRSEIESYLRKGGLLWRDDSSNLDTKFLRNRIRHEMLPLLRSYNPRITELLNSSAQALAADEELLEAVTDKTFPRLASSVDGCVRISLDLLLSEPHALRKRLYRKALSLVKGDLKRIAAKHLTDIDKLAQSKKGRGKLSLPGAVVVVKEYASLKITANPDETIPAQIEMTVDTCGVHSLPFFKRLTVEHLDKSPSDWLEAENDTIFIDLKQHPFPWTIRFFREGDRFTPFGMKGRKKLKDLFVDRKIELTERSSIPLIVCSGEIIWVCGVHVSEKTRIIGSASELLCVRMTGSGISSRH